jgi:hypothetical protein
VAIEIDQFGKAWSLRKLLAEVDAGCVALWVRWRGRTEVEIPETVGLVDIHETVDFRPTERTSRHRPAPGLPTEPRHQYGATEPPSSALHRQDHPVLPSPAEIEDARTSAGGFTRAQLAAWGVTWPPPKGWKKELNARWRAAQTEQP